MPTVTRHELTYPNGPYGFPYDAVGKTHRLAGEGRTLCGIEYWDTETSRWVANEKDVVDCKRCIARG